MVDLADIPQATALANEKQSITTALDNLEQGGRIVAMTIAPPQPERPEQPEGQPPMPLPLVMGTTVPTQAIDYPPEVTTAIEAALIARLDEIAQQLSDVGVSGVETPQRRKKGK